MKFKSREQQAAVMMQYPYTRKKKNRMFARHSSSSTIRTKPVKTTSVHYLWEKDPEGHSKAAKLGWEMRRFGYKHIYSNKEMQYRNSSADLDIWEKEKKNDAKEIRITMHNGKYSASITTYKKIIDEDDPSQYRWRMQNTKSFPPCNSYDEAKSSLLPIIIAEG